MTLGKYRLQILSDKNIRLYLFQNYCWKKQTFLRAEMNLN